MATTMSKNVGEFIKTVRTIMMGMGRSKEMIYTNLYKTGTRTVKCSLQGTSVDLFAKRVAGVAAAHNVVGVTVHSTNHHNKSMWGPRNSLIVRIPEQD
jgi:hypothetical protein